MKITHLHAQTLTTPELLQALTDISETIPAIRKQLINRGYTEKLLSDLEVAKKAFSTISDKCRTAKSLTDCVIGDIKGV